MLSIQKPKISLSHRPNGHRLPTQEQADAFFTVQGFKLEDYCVSEFKTRCEVMVSNDRGFIYIYFWDKTHGGGGQWDLQ